ncbi:hypothetical protein [Mangrovibrevibacter kandeliae]|uniref:hypothetical protein n=1 Tax=Mangrovibrevibacter kandeliae TaxID=2968473 RepID=UPI002117AB6F|nr:hypothetical protein [Aurantimonas sp. CSK15Z-1]MCQ8781706.1 hypothetical protein [Aurantimonas sp. CSK15Z-1]
MTFDELRAENERLGAELDAARKALGAARRDALEEAAEFAEQRFTDASGPNTKKGQPYMPGPGAVYAATLDADEHEATITRETAASIATAIAAFVDARVAAAIRRKDG